jgi:hypothetical protein
MVPVPATASAPAAPPALRYTLIETAKLNDVGPEAWLRDVLTCLATHPAKRIDQLLPGPGAGPAFPEMTNRRPMPAARLGYLRAP